MNTSMHERTHAVTGDGQRRVLSVPRIVFMVVAAAAPLASMVGTLPVSMGIGNGAGVPGAFLIATLTLLCFTVGYAQMSRRVVNTGAFYTFVAQGAGKAVGVCAAFVALVAYTTFMIGLLGLFAYFMDLTMMSVGVDLSWILYAAAGMTITAVLGYRAVDLSSKVLGALMLAEITVLVVFDLAVFAAKGWAAVPAASFTVETVFAPGFAIALMYAYTSFVGFESAALYSEEARDPVKTIPAATYAAVLLIGGFYLLQAWITVGAVGAAQTQEVARAQGGELLFGLINQFSGPLITALARVLLCVSFLAAYLAVHNATTRYFFALSRERLLPNKLNQLHPKHGAPSTASVAVSLITVAFLAAFGMAEGDPYTSLIPIQIGLGTLGIILLQALAAVAAVVYFRRLRSTDFWLTLVIPTLGAAGLIVAVFLITKNFGLLMALDAAWKGALPRALPFVYLIACLSGLAFALWLRSKRPQVYRELAAVRLRADTARA